MVDSISNPQDVRFSIKWVLIAITILSVIVSVLAPFIVYWTSNQLIRLGINLGSPVLMVVGTYIFCSRKRAERIKVAGSLLLPIDENKLVGFRRWTPTFYAFLVISVIVMKGSIDAFAQPNISPAVSSKFPHWIRESLHFFSTLQLAVLPVILFFGLRSLEVRKNGLLISNNFYPWNCLKSIKPNRFDPKLVTFNRNDGKGLFFQTMPDSKVYEFIESKIKEQYADQSTK